MTNPTISIIIPARNAASFIEDCIGSVLPEHVLPEDDATEANEAEVIVVDHASTDDTQNIVRKFIESHDTSVQLITALDGGGPSRAKNIGLSHAKGEFVTFLDSDDVRVGGSIAQQVQVLKDHPEAGSVFGRIAGLMDSAGTPILDRSFYHWLAAANSMNRTRGYITPADIVRHELPGYFTLLYRRSLLVAVDKFDETLPQAEDFDFAYRCALTAPMLFLDTPCVFYRVHDKNLSITKDVTGRAIPRQETRIAHERALRKHGLSG